MISEKQLYIKADEYLFYLSKFQKEEAIDSNYTFEEREAIKGILFKEELILRNGTIFAITQLGRATLLQGGLYKKYKRKKLLRIATYIAAIAGVIAAFVGIVTMYLTLMR